MKVLDIENIHIVGKNKKYTKNKYTGNLILTQEYKFFKNQIYFSAKKVNIEPPYNIKIQIWCNHDADGPAIAILDALQGKAYNNDKDIDRIEIERFKIARGKLGKIIVYVEHYER